MVHRGELNVQFMIGNSSHWPLVSIVSVNFNQPVVTGELIESLTKITYPAIEVIVVDNGSTVGNLEEIVQKYSTVKLIKSDVNLGFAGGNNLGIRQAAGDYILLLNNDTLVEPGFLEPLVEKCRRNHSIGVVSPKIYFSHTPGLLQYTGFSEISTFTTRSIGWGCGMKDENQFEEDRETFFGHGAAMLVPRHVIEKVGLMAEIFFLYYEEMDWCKRIRNAGYKIFYVHNSVVYHKESVSTGKDSPAKTYYLNRARILYMRRNVRGIKSLIAFAYQAIVAIPKNLLVFAIQGKFHHLAAYCKAILWNVKTAASLQIHHNPYL